MTHGETPDLPSEGRPHEHRLPVGVVAVIGGLAVVAAALTTIGADCLWLSALGGHIRDSGSIPEGIPFAAAPSADWVNTTALGQLVLSLANSVGSIGVVVVQVVVAVTALALLALEANARGSRPLGTALVIVVVALGAATPLLIARAQLLSFVPFVVLLSLLRRQHDRPSPAIWWAVPLVAVWGNLHGGVLIGVAVLGAYLLLSRLPVSPITAAAVGVGALGALFVNPGWLSTPRYYLGVLGSEARSDDAGMWGRLSLANPFDVLLVVAAVVLIGLALRRQQPLWEYAAALGLLVATLLAARQGLWLLLFLAVPAATAIGRQRETTSVQSRLGAAVSVGVAVGCAVAAVGVLALRGSSFEAADVASARIAELTRGEVVLAAEPLAESLAAAGATVWASDPLDAFTRGDQAAYLAFLRGDAVGAQRALSASDAVVAAPGSAQARLAVSAGLSATTPLGALSLFTR